MKKWVLGSTLTVYIQDAIQGLNVYTYTVIALPLIYAVYNCHDIHLLTLHNVSEKLLRLRFQKLQLYQLVTFSQSFIHSQEAILLPITLSERRLLSWKFTA